LAFRKALLQEAVACLLAGDPLPAVAGGHSPGTQRPERSLSCCVSTFNRQYFFEYFEGLSEHGIFHGITI
jgi:hypothetical protein